MGWDAPLSGLRYRAVHADTATAPELRMPLRVTVVAANAREACQEVRNVVEQLVAWLRAADESAARLTVLDPSSCPEELGGVMSLTANEKGTRVDFGLCVSVRLAAFGDFWSRAAGLAWAVDVVQQFTRRPWPKGVEVGPARLGSGDGALLGKFVPK
jgi:hypothetical protein